MAVQNKWVNADVEAGKLSNPAQTKGATMFGFAITFEILAADSDDSIFKLVSLGANMIPYQILINCDALTSGDDWDLGLYDSKGVVINADLFADGLDLSSALVFGSGLDGLISLPISDAGKPIYILAGDTVISKDESYILALTANTIGSAAGTITVRGLMIQG